MHPFSHNKWKKLLLRLFSAQGLQNFFAVINLIKIWQTWDKIMKNKSLHWVKWRKRTIQSFDKTWMLDYILLHTTFYYIQYWLVPTLSYSTAPVKQILAHLPFEIVLTFTENLKIDASIETATYITNGKMGHGTVCRYLFHWVQWLSLQKIHYPLVC